MLSAMDGILLTLKNLSFAQMVLAWVFVACYALALGGMLGATGSMRAGFTAALSGVLFAVFSDQWVHGALLVLFAIAGMGLFVVAAWALAQSCAWSLSQGERQPTRTPAPRAPLVGPPVGALRALRRSRVAP